MTQNEIRERLLALAQVRLKARFGAFEQFRLTLDGSPAGFVIRARAGLMPALWTAGLELGWDTAAKQIDMHFLKLIDAWAQEQAPARQISALEGLQLLPVESNTEAVQREDVQELLIDITPAQTATPAAKPGVVPATSPSSEAWKANARQIGAKIHKEKPTLNAEKIAEKTHAEMTARKAKGEPGMTGRGGKVPCAGTIKRHSQTGITA